MPCREREDLPERSDRSPQGRVGGRSTVWSRNVVYALRNAKSFAFQRKDRAVLLFGQTRQRQEVQRFILKIINNHCWQVESLLEGPRGEQRVRINLVVLIVPLEKDGPVLEEAFGAVTKEFSSTGVSLIVGGGRVPERMLLVFRWEGVLQFVEAESRHLSPMGAGFYQLGVRLIRMVNAGEHPGLEVLQF